MKPPARRAARLSGVTLSGLASVVTSAPGARPKVASMAPSTRVRSSAGSSVGVPPPKKTVATEGRSGPSADAAYSTSATA